MFIFEIHEIMTILWYSILKALHHSNFGLDEPLGILEEEIRNILLKCPKITLKEITLQVNCSLSTVNRVVNKLTSTSLYVLVESVSAIGL